MVTSVPVASAVSDSIDWSPFDKWAEDMVECQCGAQFRSHGKCTFEGDQPSLCSRKPCPDCGATTKHRAIRSDPETMTIGGQ